MYTQRKVLHFKDKFEKCFSDQLFKALLLREFLRRKKKNYLQLLLCFESSKIKMKCLQIHEFFFKILVTSLSKKIYYSTTFTENY